MNQNPFCPENILNCFEISQKDVNTLSPLTLAYLGDAVYELLIRTIVVEKKGGNVKSLHKQSSNLVNAKAQADIIHRISDLLTEEEEAVYRRGRNAKSHSVAKNAEVHDYRIATGFEALCGYLYLTGQTGRLLALLQKGLDDCPFLAKSQE